MADHFSRLTIAHDSHCPPINDEFPEESLLLVENAPWYAHIANYLAIGEVPVEWKAKHRTRNTSSPKFIPIIGRNHCCSNTVQIKSLEGVCLNNNNRGFSSTTMKIPMEVILLHKRQL